MKFELVTPEKLFTSQEGIAYVHAPGSQGDLGVLPGHMPLIATLKETGTVMIRDEEGQETTYDVSGGFMEITPTSVTVLAEKASEL
ncbi:MAG: ATP synthase F1 subunit epsilon [Alphaproteobacteria bacterium]|nr:ATP synthase F1 subunit epsilon [Alphaproteobacteria bacterium]MDD9919137.1 ATP synthase F1 subunit epsilon [Alphaproteobacteria bacterium]